MTRETRTLDQDPSAEAIPEPDDAALVARAREGSARAFDLLIRRHQGAAYRLALSVAEDPDAAEDAAQEAAVKALRGLRSFRGDASFRTWLLRIVLNEARDGIRRRGRRPDGTPLDEVPATADARPGPAAEMERRTRVAEARAAVARLPEKQRLAVLLRIDEGLSYREIGEIVGSSEGAARVNYHHGIGRLREMLG